jgi:hypothetical protein
MKQSVLQKKWVAMLCAVLCTVLWGTAYPTIKYGYAAMELTAVADKLMFAGLRFFLAGLMVFVFTWIRQRSVPRLPRDRIGGVALYGILQTGLMYIFNYIGVANTTATKTSVITAASAFFAVLLAPLFFKGERHYCLRFALAFLFVNLIGFVGYYVHPAAPPWYAINFGFEPDFSTPGNVAGLGRFDELIGFPVFHSIYVNNSNIFAAIPSLHSAYMLIATIYAVMSHQSKSIILCCIIVTLGIWATAVYSCHHYVIDVLLGILTTFVGIAIFELVVMRLPFFKRFFQYYANYIS